MSKGKIVRAGGEVSRQPHKLKELGASPRPATITKKGLKQLIKYMQKNIKEIDERFGFGGEKKESIMSDQKEKDERLTEFQMNIEVVREVARAFSGTPAGVQELMEKAVKNLEKLIAPVV